MHAYSYGAILSTLAAVLYELLIARSGIFRRWQFWSALVIVFLFQIPVDGWLTKLSSPVVIYNSHHMSGIRIFFSTPIEDFGYGFGLVTFAISTWERHGSARNNDKGYLSGGGRHEKSLSSD
ncbi:MAG: lycopene cyclase domain-containing protein [Acidimicrobiaceae bacterium]|nr:lycopene cyclase domain-containing protein [Acidimicrobiaceae bacterium]